MKCGQAFPAPSLLVAVLVFFFALIPSSDARTDLSRPGASSSSTRHFIEFHARSSGPTGHMYVVMGLESLDGRSRNARTYGFYPSGGPIAEMFSVVAAPGWLGKKKDDNAKSSSNVLKFRVSKDELASAMKVVKTWLRTKPSFHLLRRNCNSFGRSIARAIGVRAPVDVAQFPTGYLQQMKAMNGALASTTPNLRLSQQ